MSRVCTLTTRDGQPDWCQHHQMFHRGHLAGYAIDPGPKGQQFRGMWDKHSEAREGPSFLRKLGNYFISTVRHIVSGMQTAPESVQNARAAICAGCDQNENNTCLQCGCPTKPTLIGDKLARASESCPLRKWAEWKPTAIDFWQEIFRQGTIDDGWPQDWHTLPEVQKAFRAALKEKIHTLPPYPENTYSGRGIVILGGGPRYGVGVYVSARMARHHRWNGPIQVWHRGEDEPLPAGIFTKLGVELIDAYEILKVKPCRRWGMDKWGDPSNRWLSWGMKSYAALHCPFSEVLYLDADAYVIDDPGKLFTNNSAGTIAWYDLPGMESNLRWDVYGIPSDHGKGWQGGQWLIDKQRCWQALNLYRWLDDWSDYTYHYGYGDQDNMRLAWAATQTPFHVYTVGGQTVPVQPIHSCLRAWGPEDGRFIIQHRVPDKQFDQDFRPDAGNKRIRNRWNDEDLVHEFANDYRRLTG